MTKKFFGCVAIVALAAVQAWAIPIAPGVSAAAASEPDPVGGVLVAGPLVTPLNGAAFQATLTSWVYQEPNSPLGGLTFVYEVANNQVSVDPLGRVTVTGYAGWATDMSYQPGAGTIPSFMDRTANSNVIGYSFLPRPIGAAALMPGATSELLVVQTNAPRFQIAVGNVIDGSVASGPAYAPVPEPASLLLLLGSTVLCLKRRR